MKFYVKTHKMDMVTELMQKYGVREDQLDSHINGIISRIVRNSAPVSSGKRDRHIEAAASCDIEQTHYDLNQLHRLFREIRARNNAELAKHAASAKLLADIDTFAPPPNDATLLQVRTLRQSIPEDSDVAWRHEITRIHTSLYKKKGTDAVFYKTTFGILYGCYLDEEELDDRIFRSQFIQDDDTYNDVIAEWLSRAGYRIESVKFSTWTISR